MNTKNRIFNGAITLFNEQGASKTSTVQIADALEMSTGNLYYYFKNKEHLIRSIWKECISTEIDKILQQEEFAFSENGMLSFFLVYSHIVYKHRFFYEELFSILRNDPLLHQEYINWFHEKKEELLKAFLSWEELGIISPLSPEEKNLMADNLWISWQTWSNYTFILRRETYDEADIEKNGVLHAYSILSPVFTQSGKERMMRLLKSKGICTTLF